MGLPNVNSFVDEMKARGIHVGVGAKPYCACCGDPWPCQASLKGGSDEATRDGS